MTLRWVPGWNGLTEPEAVSYVAAVEAADGQELEFGVARAINDFVTGCKQDEIWDAIKACCILAGARTLDGALVSLVGGAPTNNNFVAGDYDRETGLVGDGSTKYLGSNRATNADPQNSNHISVFASSSSQAGFNNLIGTRLPGDNNSARAMHLNSGPGIVGYHNSAGATNVTQSFSSGFIGVTRLNNSSTVLRVNGANTPSSETSSALNTLIIPVFARRTGVSTLDGFSDARLAFYSIGESLDLAALDTRVSNLITAIGAAIP